MDGDKTQFNSHVFGLPLYLTSYHVTPGWLEMDGSATVVRWESVGITYAASDCREHLLSDAGCIKICCTTGLWASYAYAVVGPLTRVKNWHITCKKVMWNVKNSDVFSFFLLFHTFPIPGDLHWDSSPYSGSLSANQRLTDAHCHSCRATCSWDFGGLHGSTFVVV